MSYLKIRLNVAFVEGTLYPKQCDTGNLTNSDIASLVVNNNDQVMISTYFTLDAKYFARNRSQVTAPPHYDCNQASATVEDCKLSINPFSFL